MGTETRIGIVTGLIIVVIASVYFFYGSSSDKDEFLVATGSKIADPAKNTGPLKIPAAGDKNRPTGPAVVGNTPGKPPVVNKPATPPDKGPAVVGKPPTPGAVPPTPPSAAPRDPSRPAVTPGIAPSVAANRPPTNPLVGPPAIGIEPRRAEPVTGPVARTDSRTPGETAPGATKTTPSAEKPPESVAAVPPKSTALRTGAAKELLDATRENLEKVVNRSTTSSPADGSSNDTPRRSTQASAEPSQADRDRSRSSDSSTGETRLAKSEPRKDSTAATADRKESKESTKTAPASTESRVTPLAANAAAPAEWPKQHKIASGETIAALAQRYYGDSSKTGEILAANTQLKDPRRLKIGDTLVIPAPKETTAAASKTASKPPVETAEKAQAAKPTDAKATPPKPSQAASAKTYQVRDGDTFYSIAKALYGNKSRWTEIYELNKTTLKNDPKHLRPGMVLKLPE